MNNCDEHAGQPKNGIKTHTDIVCNELFNRTSCAQVVAAAALFAIRQDPIAKRRNLANDIGTYGIRDFRHHAETYAARHEQL